MDWLTGEPISESRPFDPAQHKRRSPWQASSLVAASLEEHPQSLESPGLLRSFTASFGYVNHAKELFSLSLKRKSKRSRRKNKKALQGSRNKSLPVVNGDNAASTSDIIPWGTKLILGSRDPGSLSSLAESKYVFLMDTGISSTTGDLNVRREWGINFISPGSDPEDDNGHGTHLAGTIGALSNSFGITGVAPGVNLIAYKVLDHRGLGEAGTVANAINQMIERMNNSKLDPKDVIVNLSFAARGDDQTLRAAIAKAASLGVRFAIAAGNAGIDIDGVDGNAPFHPASSKQAQANVYVTSAINQNLEMAKFSNYDNISGPDDLDNIAFAAPGENILSWYRRMDGSFTLTSLSGTSMATAHLAGLLALGDLRSGPMASSDGLTASDPLALLGAAAN
jgi:subtilisin family serine protease